MISRQVASHIKYAMFTLNKVMDPNYFSSIPLHLSSTIPLLLLKLFQSCLTLCEPIDGSPPGSPAPGILQARVLEWVAIAFSPMPLGGLSAEFSSVAQSCPTLCDPMNRRTPGLPVHHQLPEFSQTHFHRVSDTIQPSHPLLSPSPPAPNPSQHKGLFQRVNSSHEVAKVLEFQL